MRCRLILVAVAAVGMVSLATANTNAADLLDRVMTVSFENGCGAAPAKNTSPGANATPRSTAAR